MGAASVENVVFSYGSRRVIDGLDIHFRAGALTAVKGANGSGKSTLLGLIAGTLRPSQGAVHLAEAARPALVLQHSAVSQALPLTVRAAVEMGCWGNRSWLRRLRAQERGEVAELLDRLGLTELAHRQLGELSGGQRQRVLLAQGLAQRSKLLLLDEPTAGVDEQSHARIREVIAHELARGVAVIEVTHSNADAAEAGRVLVLADGRLVSDSLGVA
ncbi:zinc ABC transporter ATP-binding protein AztA [Arthrobacter glacialis]|uniref:ABC transporter ATP-binding protein n=1 Tax=Arthrobacter glacialis TaxID=1664 RepID=A0A2S4A283_ARTGL|nr:zinc ABC transporter ATP-binding protein AztA [Arthrobacter glacialis]POH61281.1 ABC transporter ATP-binding protein [Arthrobacter glacialis]POH75429.1 ABC transporter ATP-binding protein [Arthrobacter glacialis]